MDFSIVLKNVGINYDSAMKRFHGNENMYFKYLFRLPEETLVSEAKGFFEKNDSKNAEFSIHTLKGLLGNLSIDSLFDLDCEILDKLRLGDFNEAKQLFFAVFLNDYQRLIAAIEQAKEAYSKEHN